MDDMTSTTEQKATQGTTDAATLKDRITAPETAPARRRTGAGAAAVAAGTAGMWLWRKYRTRMAARRRKTAARNHFKVIRHETGAVMRLAGQALGDRARQGAGAARKQTGTGASVVGRQVKARANTARAKVRR